MRSTYSVARVLTLALALFSFFPLTGVAQDADQPTNAPAHLSFVDGSATLEREGQAETAVSGMPFVPGDRLQTTRGRVEVLFADGSALAVDEFTTIELQDRALLRMAHGTSPAHGFGRQRSGERHSLPDRYAVGLSLDRWPWRIPDRGS